MFGDNLKKLRNQRHLSQGKLADKLNSKYKTSISKSMISRWERGATDPQMKYVRIIADFFNVSTALVDDKSSQSSDQPDNVFYPISAGYQRVSIPVVGEIVCGDPITADENIDGYTEEVFKKPIPDGQLFALRCKGHSMEPTIPDGALAIVREQPEVEDGEIAAVLVDHDSEATLKRIKHQGQLVMLLPDNNDYDPIILSKDNPGRIIGKVIHVSWDIK